MRKHRKQERARQKNENKYIRRLYECKICRERYNVKRDCERFDIECVSYSSLLHNQTIRVHMLYLEKKPCISKQNMAMSVAFPKENISEVSRFWDSLFWSYENKDGLLNKKNSKECGDDQMRLLK
ncbi:hypothetical protein AVEN_154939-1 [Araneus ventricosus]|uniref:Uncharacterized protein n=1 Tax=Araneus ventricosus TaxID=182803 RepID=A0A4Y2A715_ARAVE|nr:hypothetical protein AVEN_154939-1 [Araneus ventricosus]